MVISELKDQINKSKLTFYIGISRSSIYYKKRVTGIRSKHIVGSSSNKTAVKDSASNRNIEMYSRELSDFRIREKSRKRETKEIDERSYL